MKDKKTPLTNEDIFAALNVYIQDYIHRDTHMWSQIYKFFTATLIVTLLPYLTERLAINLPIELKNKLWIFPLFGIIMSLLFLNNSIVLIRRFQSVGKTYNKLIDLLPEELQRNKINQDLSPKIRNANSYITPVAMFIFLFIVSAYVYAVEFI